MDPNKENKKRNKLESQIPVKINSRKPAIAITPEVPAAATKPIFKNLDAALASLNADDLDNTLTMISFNYKDNDLMLLKSVSTFACSTGTQYSLNIHILGNFLPERKPPPRKTRRCVILH